MMEKWISSIALIVLVQSSLNLEDGSCSCGKSAVGGEQVTCQNVTPSFFHHVKLNLSRAHWFACDSCILSAITEDTFSFARNNVSYLILNQTRIHYIGNFAFNKLPLLKMLNLKENLIDTIEYKAFFGIRKLLQLDLSFNRLKTLENIFSDLENLDILNLNSNQISFIEPNAFAGLTNLKYLYLNGNKLHRLQPENFKHLVSLKILYLENNGMEQLHPLAFNDLRNLNHLYLNNNSISFLVQYSFKELTSLLELQLRHNNLSEIQTSAFNGLRKIKYLYLSENSLTTIKPYGFIGLNSVLILDLIGNKFDHFSLEYLNGMEYLSSVWLQNNSISNVSVTKLADTLGALRVLNLLSNKLGSINYRFLYEKMPKLEQIVIGDNEWNCEVLVQMFEYFEQQNVSVCLDYKCMGEETEGYVREVCKNVRRDEGVDRDGGVGEDKGVDVDFVLDSSVLMRCNLRLISLQVFVVFTSYLYKMFI